MLSSPAWNSWSFSYLPLPWSWWVDSIHRSGSHGRKLRWITNFGASRDKGSWSYLLVNLPGAQTSSWTLGSQNLVILIGFVIIKCSRLLLLTNPNPRGRYQSKDGFDCVGALPNQYPDQTLEPGGAPVLFHQDRTDHVVNRRGIRKKAVNQRIEENQWICMNAARHTRSPEEPILCEQWTIKNCANCWVWDTISSSPAAECP